MPCSAQRTLLSVWVPLCLAQSACAPMHARTFSARLPSPHTFTTVCPNIEAHADSRGDAIRRRCNAPPGPDGQDAFIAQQGDRISYRIDGNANGRELTYLVRTRAPADMSWGSDNAQSELDMLEAEHRAVLERAVARGQQAPVPAERTSEDGLGTSGDGTPTVASPSESSGDRGPRVETVTAPTPQPNPLVPGSLFGLAVGWDHLGARVGLRNWNSTENGFELGMSFLGSSADGSTALVVGGNAGFMLSLAAAHDARLFLEPEVGVTIIAAEGIDSAVGFYGALAFGVEYLIARRGLPVMGLHAKALAGIERLALDGLTPGLSVAATSFGFIGGAVGVAAYFNKP